MSFCLFETFLDFSGTTPVPQFQISIEEVNAEEAEEKPEETEGKAEDQMSLKEEKAEEKPEEKGDEAVLLLPLSIEI